MLLRGKIDWHEKYMLAQLYSRTVRVSPSGRRIDFFENNLRLAKLSLRLKARESLSTESVNDCSAWLAHRFCDVAQARNGLANIFFTFTYVNLPATTFIEQDSSHTYCAIRIVASKLIQANARSM